MRYLLDTNICIFLIRERSPGLRLAIGRQRPADVGLSVVTSYELHYGAHRSARLKQNLKALATFLRPFAVVPFSADDAVKAGELRAELERRGTPIGPYDLLIAAQAATRTLTLVTNNIREFARVPGLAVEDWTAPGG